jgi:hypothetical protein
VRVYDMTTRFVGLAQSDTCRLVPKRLVATNVSTPAP